MTPESRPFTVSTVKQLRISPVQVDVALSLVLLALSELAIWWGRSGVAREHTLGVAIIAAVITGSVAVRRRHPFVIGISAVARTDRPRSPHGDAAPGRNAARGQRR